MKTAWFPVMILLCTFTANAAEIVKWVDEQGNVHYGEKVPEEYKDSAEDVKTEINVVAPEEDVKMQNRKHVSQLKREDEWKKSQQAQRKNQGQQNSNPRVQKKEYTREECRDRHPSRTADRVACFRRAEEAAND